MNTIEVNKLDFETAWKFVKKVRTSYLLEKSKKCLLFHLQFQSSNYISRRDCDRLLQSGHARFKSYRADSRYKSGRFEIWRGNVYLSYNLSNRKIYLIQKNFPTTSDRDIYFFEKDCGKIKRSRPC